MEELPEEECRGQEAKTRVVKGALQMAGHKVCKFFESLQVLHY